jgi:hypothetical protein
VRDGRLKPHIQFVTETWPEGKPELGATNSEHNLLGSLEASGLATFERFGFDKYFASYGRAGDLALLTRCRMNKPDLLVMSWLHDTPYNPSDQTLRVVREELGIPVAAVWWDSAHDRVLQRAETLDPLVDLHLVVDSSDSFRGQVKNPDKYVALWAPQDPRIYHDPGLVRDMDISFVGTLYPERQAGVLALRSAGIEVAVGGGQRTTPISLADYARVHMRSKIALNFARNLSTYQVKGRVFEATLCGAMLLEMANPETERWLTPMVDYVPFTSREDLIDKARYYLAHDDERAAIAEHGKQTVQRKYSNEVFWQTVLERALAA